MLLTTAILQTEERHEVDLSILRALCYQSARLYNASLYSVRQHFFETGKFLRYGDNWNLLKTGVDYKMLQSDASQQIMKNVDRDMSSFFRLLSMKKAGKYTANVHIPRYKDKEGYTICPIYGRAFRIKKDGVARFTLTKPFIEKYNLDCKYIQFTIPSHLREVKQFNEVRIIPQYGGKQFKVEFIYEAPQPRQATGNGYLSVDMGVSNLMACVSFSNGRSHQFLVDGKRAKHINYYYNKKLAGLKSANPDSNRNTKRMIRLYNGREQRLNDYFSKVSRMVVNYCLDNEISHVVVGYNKEQKQEVNIGKVNSQNLCYIPHYKLRRKLQYLCELHGIEYISHEESYTSKASCLDMDEIPVYKPGSTEEHKFSGRRVHRGLYKSSDGSLLNADINGAVNILRKYFKERKENWLFQDSVRALVNAPCLRVSPWTQAHRL